VAFLLVFSDVESAGCLALLKTFRAGIVVALLLVYGGKCYFFLLVLLVDSVLTLTL
jgi:hypothetical protein